MTLQPSRRRFTVDEYYRMAEAGILTEDDRVELIEGEIIEMTPIGSRHAGCVAELVRLFLQGLGKRAVVWPQNPVRLSEHSEPEPDVALLRPRSDQYRSAHPTSDDVLLVVEVAETSAEWDRRVKVPLCARAGILELWRVELRRETITVYREPTPDGYRVTRILRRGEKLAPEAFPDCELSVDDILGPQESPGGRSRSRRPRS